MAIEEGTNLKNYIEKLLSDIADNYEDSELYAKLSKEHPEGHIILNQEEKTDFEKWLDEWFKRFQVSKWFQVSSFKDYDGKSI